MREQSSGRPWPAGRQQGQARGRQRKELEGLGKFQSILNESPKSTDCLVWNSVAATFYYILHPEQGGVLTFPFLSVAAPQLAERLLGSERGFAVASKVTRTPGS